MFNDIIDKDGGYRQLPDTGGYLSQDWLNMEILGIIKTKYFER